MEKKCWTFALALLLALTLAACGGNTATNNETTDEQSANPISGKVYQVNAHGDLFQWKWCKFYEDGTFLGISATWTGSVGGKPNYSYSKYYGVYSTDGAKLALDIGADSYAGVIKEDGETLYFGETELLDYTDKLNSDRLMSMFNSSNDGETATPIANAPTEPASDGESPTRATLDELLSALKEGLSKGLTRENSEGDCTVTRDGNLVTITIWDEKATKVAVSAASGNEDNLARWNQFASDMATTEKTCEDSLEAYGHAEAIIHFYVVDYENHERKLLSISGGKILYDSVNNALSNEAGEPNLQSESTVEPVSESKSESESAPKNTSVSPTFMTEGAIRAHITAKYSGVDIDSITLNEDLGTETESDYIALVYLTWNVQNSGELSKKVLKMYSDDLAATVAKDAPDIQEIAIFWTVPYLNASAKCAYERRGEGMYEMDMMWDSAFN